MFRHSTVTSAAAAAVERREPEAPLAGDRQRARRSTAPPRAACRSHSAAARGEALRQALLLAQERLPLLVEHLGAAPRDLEAAQRARGARPYPVEP